MAPNHLRVVVPVLEIVDLFTAFSHEREGCCVFVHFLLASDVVLVISHFVLAFNHTDNHGFDNVESGLSVMVWPSALDIDEVVTAEEEF